MSEDSDDQPTRRPGILDRLRALFSPATADASSEQPPGATMSDDERMAHLRSMLNDPERDADAILTHLETWEADHSREAASRYARDYFERHQPSNLRTALRFPADSHMLFDAESRTLFTNHGEVIKQLECPRSKCWDELEVLDDADLKRHCRDCEKHVVDTRDLTDLQVQVLVQYDPTVCLHIDSDHGNLTLVNPPPADHHIRRARPGLRVIKTARSLAAINRAAAEGLWPLVRFARPSGRIRSNLDMWQNNTTGEVVSLRDFREQLPGAVSDWRHLSSSGNIDGYDPSDHFSSPVAAYLIPDDLEVGQRVVLEDLIENFIDYHHNGPHRLSAATAIWNGAELEIDYDERRDIMMAIG